MYIGFQLSIYSAYKFEYILTQISVCSKAYHVWISLELNTRFKCRCLGLAFYVNTGIVRRRDVCALILLSFFKLNYNIYQNTCALDLSI